jgi:hypothetical protein
VNNIVQFHEGFLKKTMRIREEMRREEKREVKNQIQNSEAKKDNSTMKEGA